jgi:hypothetical protein
MELKMKTSPVRKPAPLRVPGLRSGVRLAVVAIGLLSAGGALTGSVRAQNAGAPGAKADAAHAAWRKLSQSEVNCVDKALRARNSQIWQLIQRGVGPGDSSVAGVRAACRSQTTAQASATAASGAPAARATQAPAVQQPASQASAHQGPGREHWSFDGSILKMVAEGRLRKFFYLQPGPEAEAAGVQRGDLLLEGNVSDQRITGTVYSHGGRCGRIPYRVDGTIRDNNRRLELQGQKPQVDGGCKVVGTVLDALTFTTADSNLAAAPATPAAKPPASRPVNERLAIERAADVMAAVDRATAEKAESEDASEFKTVSEKASAERRASGQATPVKVVLAAASESKVAVNEAVADKASAGAAVEISRAEAARAQAQAEQARSEAEKAIAEAIAMAAQAQAKVGFIYGLMCGPALLGAGAAVFLFLRRRNRLRLAQSEGAALDGVAEPRTLSLQH